MQSTSIYNRATALAAATLFILGFQPAVYGQETAVQSDFEHKINFYNVNGSPLMNQAADVKGNPYFLKDWKDAAVYTARNETFMHIRIRIDLQHQLLHFVNSEKTELIATPGAVKEVMIFDTTAGIANLYDFRCGYPAIDNQNETNFYLVMITGKIALLKSLRKSVRTVQDGFSGDTDKELNLYEDYYFFTGNKMQRVKRNKASVLDLMADKKNKVEAYVEGKNLGFKSIDNIGQIIGYYNGLP